MTVKIITDSTSDITPEVASALGITVAPVTIKFGEEEYKDGVDINVDEFYTKLVKSPVSPQIMPPTPDDFVNVYNECGKETDSLLSIHFSNEKGGAYDSALMAKWMMKGKCHIEIVDATFISIGMALIIRAAAEIAETGESLLGVFDETKKAISQVGILGMLDTNKYLLKAEKIGKATASLTNMLNNKQICTVKNGDIVRAGLAGNSAKGMDKLRAFVESNYTLQDLAIAHSNVSEAAEQLKSLLATIYDKDNIHITRLGAALGMYCGPGALFVAYRQGY